MEHPSRIAVRSSDDKAEDKGVAITLGIERLPRVGHWALPKMAFKIGRGQRRLKHGRLDSHVGQCPLGRGHANCYVRAARCVFPRSIFGEVEGPEFLYWINVA